MNSNWVKAKVKEARAEMIERREIPRPSGPRGTGDGLTVPEPEQVAVPRPKVAHIDRPRPEQSIKYGPPQLPVEELAGIFMDRSAVELAAKDNLGRDVFSKDSRLAEWEETEELHQLHRGAPLPVDTEKLYLPPYGVHLLSGSMGVGKTLTCAFLARRWYRAGWPVFSTAGFLFGQRLTLAEAYAFPDVCTPGSFIFVDEVHTLVDRYSGNSVRARTFGQASTALRKERVTCIGASANSAMVGGEFKAAAEYVLVPKRWYPKGRRLHAPPFCHVTIQGHGPWPYRRRDQLLEDLGFLDGMNQKIFTWKPNPIEVMAAAKLIDSFEAVRIGENFALDAKAMRAMRAEQQTPKEANAELVVEMLQRLYEADHLPELESYTFGLLRTALEQAGVKVSAAKIRESLELGGCSVSQRGITAEELAGFCRYLAERDGT